MELVVENGKIVGVKSIQDQTMSQSTDTLEFLEHHGIKGMKWGIQNKQSIKPSSDYKKTAGYRKRKPQELTNKQLQQVNARIKLEDTYRKSHPSVANKSKTAVVTVLGTAALIKGVHELQNHPTAMLAVKSGKSFVKKLLNKS
jgi:hypothetical protein